METIQDSVQVNSTNAEGGMIVSRPSKGLPPKGSCWYCEKPLDNVRRFCGKECADGFDDEAAFSGPNVPA